MMSRSSGGAVMSYVSRAAFAAASILFAFSVVAAEQSSNASGTLKVNSYTTNLHYAYARHDAQDNATRVLITNRPVDAGMLADESLRGRLAQGPFSAIELIVNANNEVETVTVFDKQFDMPTPTTGLSFWYEPYKMMEGWVGGRSRTKQGQSFFKTKWEYDVAFFAPVGQKTFEAASASAIAAQRKTVDARESKRALPANGGEEGAMYLAYRRNLEAKNTKALLDQMTPSMKSAIAEQMHASQPLSESALESWAFMQSMPPGKVEVVGGTRDAVGTTLELRKTSGERQTFGTAKLVKDQGAWKVTEERWR